MSKDQNRRRYTRYRAQQLLVEVKVSATDRHADRVKSLDFNAHGLAFTGSGQPYEMGQHLLLNIKLEKVSVTDLVAEVKNIQDDRYGLAFVFESDYMKSTTVLDGLDAMTELLKTSRSADSGTGLRSKRKRERFSDK